MVELVPHMPEIIVDMWNAAMLRHGWQLVDSTIKTKHKVALTALAKEVYSAYTASKGSEEALKQLIQMHAPRQTATQNPSGTPSATPSGTPTTSLIPLTDPNSSTNQVQPQGMVAGEVARGAAEGVQDPSKLAQNMVQDPAKLASNAVQELFERNRKLRPLKLNHGTLGASHTAHGTMNPIVEPTETAAAVTSSSQTPQPMKNSEPNSHS